MLLYRCACRWSNVSFEYADTLALQLASGWCVAKMQLMPVTVLLASSLLRPFRNTRKTEALGRPWVSRTDYLLTALITPITDVVNACLLWSLEQTHHDVHNWPLSNTILTCGLNLGGAMLFTLKRLYNMQKSLMHCRPTRHCTTLHCRTSPMWQQSCYHMGLTGMLQALADSPDDFQSISRIIAWLTSNPSLHDSKCIPCIFLSM